MTGVQTCALPISEVIERLLKVVGKSPLLRTLDEEQKDMIVSAFAGPILKDAGELIIKQGDIGDVFYLLESGSVNVFVAKRGEESKKVYSYGSGDAFGELALMYNAPRAASIIALEDSTLFSLDRDTFNNIVKTATIRRRETYENFLKKVEILADLEDYERAKLCDCLKTEKFEKGDFVIKEGDIGDKY